MRNTFINTVSELAAKDSRIVFFTGDLGYSVLEDFAEKYPSRFYNFGVSEQNMVGAAAGMALCGKKVISYSIATFACKRPYEQIRVDVAFQKADVKIVGVGGGYPYGSLGPTHHATEDIAIMRSLPNMVVLCPGDPVEAEIMTKAALAHDGPVYLRLGKGGEETVHKGEPAFSLGKAITLQEGTGTTVISTGGCLAMVAAAVKQIPNARFLSMPCVKPIDKEAILAAAKETKHIIVVEEHQGMGGFGSAVAEVLAPLPTHAPLTQIAVPDRFMDEAGSQEHLRGVAGITVEKIVQSAQRFG
ncbi:MAG: transketolase [Candidatus Woesearchaeota archaeon]|nr:transketolase [Candidatus Woesearchaeota archaeon]